MGKVTALQQLSVIDTLVDNARSNYTKWSAALTKTRKLKYQFVAHVYLVGRYAIENDTEAVLSGLLKRDKLNARERNNPFLAAVKVFTGEAISDQKTAVSQIAAALKAIHEQYKKTKTAPTVDTIVAFIEASGGLEGLYQGDGKLTDPKPRKTNVEGNFAVKFAKGNLYTEIGAGNHWVRISVDDHRRITGIWLGDDDGDAAKER